MYFFLSNLDAFYYFTCLISVVGLLILCQIKVIRRGIQVGKEEVQLSLHSGDMILYRENPEDSTKKLLELMNEFICVAGYKINTEKSVVIL